MVGKVEISRGYVKFPGGTLPETNVAPENRPPQ